MLLLATRPWQVLDTLVYCHGWPAPMALAGMTGLQTLLSWTLPPSAELPAGDYLRRLRRLALPAEVAGRSLDALSAAQGLQELELSWPREFLPGTSRRGKARPSASQPALAALRWAARHPALRRLCTCLGDKPAPAALLDAVTAAQRANPSLRIHSHSSLNADLLRGTRTYT